MLVISLDSKVIGSQGCVLITTMLLVQSKVPDTLGILITFKNK